MKIKEINDRLFIIDAMLENLKTSILDNDIKINNSNIMYLLTSIEVNARRTKEILKEN